MFAKRYKAKHGDRATYPKNNVPIVNRDERLADFSVTVTRFVTDVDGILIDKNLLPVNMQVSYNYALFGEFDRQGGYRLAQEKLGLKGVSQYVGVFTHGVHDGFLQFNTIAEIYGRLRIGDIYFLYTDDLNNPTYFVFVVISNPYGSMGSITANTAFHHSYKSRTKNCINVTHFKMQTSTPSQYAAPLFYIVTDSIGTNTSDSINPLASRSIDDKLNDFIQIDFPFKITQFFELISFMKFSADQITFNFKLLY